MTATILLPVDLLKAALVCCSTEETRYYLNGVCITPSGHIVSTDGHRLFAGRYADNPVEGELIIPLAAIKKALTGYKGNDITLSDSRKAGGSCTLGDITFTPVDGTFPDWKRILPSGTGPEYTPSTVLPDDEPGKAQFNAAYLGDLGKISKLLTGKPDQTYIHVWTASSPAGVSFAGRDDALCVIMPRRAHHGPWTETLNAVVPTR
jgi:DNA polymerase III sliding clamp (beta) subunit (PCNA family)